MPTKMTMVFQNTTNISNTANPRRRTGGWTEVFYEANPLSEAIMNTFFTACEYRAALLPNSASIVGQRFQTIDPIGPGQSTSRFYPGSSGLLTDAPQLALQITIRGDGVRNVVRRKIKCIPDARVVEGEYSPSDNFTIALDNYFKRGLAGYDIRGRDLSLPESPVYKIGADGAYTTETDNAFAAGQFIYVLRTKTTSGRLRGGRFRLLSVATSKTGVIQDWPHGATTGGKMRAAAIIYANISAPNIAVDQIVIAKIGAPSKRYRGRASKRA